MTRPCLTAAFVALFALPCSAAPVPDLKAAKKKELDELYARLSQHFSSYAMSGLIPLAARPATEVVSYLAEKLKPLKLTEKQAKQLIEELGSDDKKVAEAAFAEMGYFDTRLAMTPQEAFKLSPQGLARQRLAAAWEGYPIDFYADSRLDIERWMLRKDDGSLEPQVGLTVKNNEKSGYSHTLPMAVADIQLIPWKQATRAVLLLEHFNTPDAVAVLKTMASGEEALPTKAAKEALERLGKKTPPKPDLGTAWDDLLGDDMAAARAGLLLLKHKGDALTVLKRTMQPLKLDEKRCRELLKDLGSDDEKTALAARKEFEYFHPLLAFDVKKLSDEAPDGLMRTRLFELLHYEAAFDSFRGQTIALQEREGGYLAESKGKWTSSVDQKVEYLDMPAWKRLLVGYLLLEQIGTPDAVKVLESMAAGHKDARPTKYAKAILDRMKK